MRKLNSQFITKCISEAGLDKKNGTYYGFVELDHYYCVAVAEGYDDDGGTESARIAVDMAIEAFVQKPGMSAGSLSNCLKKAHRNMLEQSVRIRLKAGILLFVSDYTRCRYAVCGNVLLYHLRGNNVLHQSATHTMYQTMLEQQEQKIEKEGPLQETKNLYYFLGGEAGIKVSPKQKLKEADAILIATERFWNRVTKVEVLDAFESFTKTEEFLGDLQELYVKDSKGYIGSYSLVAIDIKNIYKENTRLKKRIIFWTLLLLLLLVIGLTLFYVVSRKKSLKQQEVYDQLSSYEEMGDNYLVEMDSQFAIKQYEKVVETSVDIRGKEEQIAVEEEMTAKISIATNLEQAEQAYESMEFKKSLEGYRKTLKQLRAYPELSGLKNTIQQQLKMVQYGMEIDTYIQSGTLKEAEKDMEAAETLYGHAESMLRVVNYPDLLKQVQLSLLRVREQVAQDGKQETAEKGKQVLLEVEEQTALEAALAEDYENAITLYTAIRDGYVDLEYNEKAKEISMLLTLLQKQAQSAQKAELSKDMYADRLLQIQEEALQAVIQRDFPLAMDKYDQMIQIYIASGNTEALAQAEAAIEYLEKQPEGEPANGQ